MSIKVIKMMLMVFASVLMGVLIWFISDESIIDIIAGSYFLVVNTFLGVDLASMLKKSSKLPSGEYKKINYYKYVTALIFMFILFGLAMYRKESANVQALSAISSFGGSAMLIIGYILGGLEANKILTDKDGNNKN